MIFLQFVGFGGKMAINIFVLISAYFMCTQKVTWKRVWKLVAEVYFYGLIFYCIFLVCGYETINIKSVSLLLLGMFHYIGSEFVGSFIVFYLLIPFLNVVLKQLPQKQHLYLVLLSVIVFSLGYTFLLANDSCRYVLWFIVLYFIASYIRLYPNRNFASKSIALYGSLASLLVIWLSILAVDFIGVKFGITKAYFLCFQCQTFLALTLSLSLFLLFKNINIKQSRVINTFAASTFGVLLIHANSNAMRTWLWQDFLNVPSQYASPFLPIHFVISVLGIYIVCVGIDYLRIRYVEKPLFKELDKYSSLQKECFFE